MKVTLLDYTQNPVDAIGAASAICYNAKIDRESNIKRAIHCKDKGHLATMRFAYATFHIEGISRVCSHQLVRVAHAGILQESQRYVEQSHVKFITPPSIEELPKKIKARWEKLIYESQEVYAWSVTYGMKKEDARYALLQSCTTQLNICMNFQGWNDFLRNRTSKTAQWEIRDVAIEIQRQLAEIAPGIFEA